MHDTATRTVAHCTPLGATRQCTTRSQTRENVIGLTLTKALLLALAALVLDLPLSLAGVTAGLGLDAASHWWADRRSSLAWLAEVTGKSEFYSLGTGAHPAHPITAEGKPAGHLGTGAYALDQSFHVFFLFLAALLIAAL